MMRLAVLAPMPGTPRMRSTSPLAMASQMESPGRPVRSASAPFGPDAGDADQQVEESHLVGGGEAVEGDVGLAGLEVGVERYLAAGHAEGVARVAGDLDEQPEAGAVDANGDALGPRVFDDAPDAGDGAHWVALLSTRCRERMRLTWHNATASASAASKGSGTSRRPSCNRTISCTCSFGPRP